MLEGGDEGGDNDDELGREEEKEGEEKEAEARTEDDVRSLGVAGEEGRKEATSTSIRKEVRLRG